MILPRLAPNWLPAPVIGALGEWLRIIEAADDQNLKRGQDVEMADSRVILTSPDGTRYAISVANDGTLSTSAV